MALDLLFEHHVALFDDEIKPRGVISEECLKEFRTEGESRLSASRAADLLLDHRGLAAFEAWDGGWSCARAAGQLAQALSRMDSKIATELLQETRMLPLRLKRVDWMILLELCLAAGGGPLFWAPVRADFQPWPLIVDRLIASAIVMAESPANAPPVGQEMKTECAVTHDRIPPLGLLCARIVAREPTAFGISYPVGDQGVYWCCKR